MIGKRPQSIIASLLQLFQRLERTLSSFSICPLFDSEGGFFIFKKCCHTLLVTQLSPLCCGFCLSPFAAMPTLYHCAKWVVLLLQIDISLSSQQYKPVPNWSAFEADISKWCSEIGNGLTNSHIYTSNLIRPHTEHHVNQIIIFMMVQASEINYEPAKQPSLIKFLDLRLNVLHSHRCLSAHYTTQTPTQYVDWRLISPRVKRCGFSILSNEVVMEKEAPSAFCLLREQCHQLSAMDTFP